MIQKQTQKEKPPIDQPGARVIALVLLLAFFWGANTVLLKMALEDMPPLAIAGFRFLLGMLVIFFWAAGHRIPLALQKGERLSLVLLSLLFTMQIATFNLGTKFTYAAHSTILINTHPFFTALMAHFLVPGDVLNRRKTLGLAVAFGGIFVVFRDNFQLHISYLHGDLLVLASGFLLGTLGVFTKLLIQRINPYKLLIWEMLLSLPFFFGLSLCIEGVSNYHFSYVASGSILYQGIVVGGFCFTALTLVLKRHSPSKIAALQFATPLFGVLLSNIFLREPITLNLGIGGCFVALGIYIVNRA